MENHIRLFTVEEANALLPELEKILKRFDQKKRISEKMHDELLMEELLCGSSSSAVSKSFLEEEAARLDQALSAIESEIHAIRALGCKVRFLSKGWVDFPAQRGEMVVFFVWKRGEDAVRYYREVEDPLQLLPL